MPLGSLAKPAVLCAVILSCLSSAYAADPIKIGAILA